MIRGRDNLGTAMTQPKFAPIQIEDQVRDTYRLRTPEAWAPDRPADYRPGPVPQGRGFGVAGPDQGYALHLVHHLEPRLSLAVGESMEDAVAGCVAIAMRRASLFGRAPVMPDLELAFALAGYLGEAPPDLLSWRVARFRGIAHDHWSEGELATAVPESSLRLTPGQVASRIADWRAMIGAGPAAVAADAPASAGD
jgi:hypothetical protein